MNYATPIWILAIAGALHAAVGIYGWLTIKRNADDDRAEYYASRQAWERLILDRNDEIRRLAGQRDSVIAGLLDRDTIPKTSTRRKAKKETT